MIQQHQEQPIFNILHISIFDLYAVLLLLLKQLKAMHLAIHIPQYLPSVKVHIYDVLVPTSTAKHTLLCRIQHFSQISTMLSLYGKRPGRYSTYSCVSDEEDFVLVERIDIQYDFLLKQ